MNRCFGKGSWLPGSQQARPIEPHYHFSVGPAPAPRKPGPGLLPMILTGLLGTPDLPEAGACDSGWPMSQSFLTIPKNTEIDSGAGMCSKKGQQSHLVESLRKRGSLSLNQDHGR